MALALGSVTISLGQVKPEQTGDESYFLERTDAALYRAKSEG